MIKLLFIVCMLIVIPNIGFCETYKWRDDNGTLGFTDDISRVPEKYRNQINSIPSPSASPSSQNKMEKLQNDIDENDSDQSPSIDIAPGNSLDSFLKNKWNQMISFLRKNEIEKALDLMYPQKRDTFRQVFNALSSQLPFILSTWQDITFQEVAGSRSVRYELTTNENGTLYVYHVVFLIDPDGVWWIYDF